MSDIRKYMKERNNIDMENDDEEMLEKKLKKHKRGKLTKILLLLAVILIAAFSYYIYIKNKVYTE